MENLDVEKLINEIHVRPAIWDMQSNEYSNKIIKKRAWEEVTEIFVGEDATQREKREIGSTLQKKWKNIRDRYSRELKETKGRSGQARKGKSLYVYAKQLAFLSNIIHRRSTDTSMDNMNLPSPYHETSSPLETAAVPETLDEPFDEPVANRKKGNLVERKLLKAIEEHNIRQKGKSQTERVNSYEDDDKLFLLSLLPFLKSVPPHFKFAVRMEIMQTIHKFMNVQPPAPHLYPQQLYNQNRNQPPGHPSGTQGQYLNLQSGSTGVRSYYSQNSGAHGPEPQSRLFQSGSTEVQSHYSQNPGTRQPEPQPSPSGTQHGSSKVQPYFNQSSSINQQEPRLESPEIPQQNATLSPLASPIGSLYSQDDTEMSLF